MTDGYLRERRSHSYRLLDVNPASLFARLRGPRASAGTSATVALMVVGVVAAGCSQGGGDIDPPPPTTPDTSISPSTAAGSDQRPERRAFDDALAQAGLGDLPAPVADTLATLGSTVCEAGGGESQKDERLAEIMPVAESVASLVPGIDAQRVADTVYGAGVKSFCP